MIEFSEQDKSVFDDIVLLLKRSPGFADLCLKDESVLSFLDLEIYPDRRKVYIGLQEIHLTSKEYDLLCLLTANQGRVLTYIQIYQRIWGEEALGNESNSVGCHIRNLRKKLCAASPSIAEAIRCVREVGYCFNIKSE